MTMVRVYGAMPILTHMRGILRQVRTCDLHVSLTVQKPSQMYEISQGRYLLITRESPS